MQQARAEGGMVFTLSPPGRCRVPAANKPRAWRARVWHPALSCSEISRIASASLLVVSKRGPFGAKRLEHPVRHRRGGGLG